jgi:hypothetical protein
LESYHPYLLPQEVSKTPTTLGTYDSLPKIRKGCFGFLRPLGIKGDNIMENHEPKKEVKRSENPRFYRQNKLLSYHPAL